MAGNEDSVESPMELLRQLIEESGKWTEEMVTLSRKLIIIWIYAIFQTILVIWLVVFYLIPREPIPLTYLVFVGVCVVFLIMNLANVLVRLRRNYRNRLAGRDRWRGRFEVLKKKEEEIEKLLSEGAD
jgi:hypothetical protein